MTQLRTTRQIDPGEDIIIVLPDNRNDRIVSRIEQVEAQGEQFWGGADAYPNTDQLTDKPCIGLKVPPPKWNKSWIAAHIALNQQNSDDAVDKLLFPSTGVINPKDGQQDTISWRNLDELPRDIFLRPESVVMAGAMFPVKEIYGTRENPKSVLIETFSPDDEPPNPETFNYKTAALGGCINVMAIHRNRHYSLIGSGSEGADTNIYYYPMTPDGYGWLDLEGRYADKSFAFLPSLPRRATVTASRGLSVRKKPTRENNVPVRYLKYGETFWITQYYPTVDGIWGRLIGGTWVCLCWVPIPGRAIGYMWQYTTWRLPDLALYPIRPGHPIPGRLPILQGSYGEATNQDVINAIFAAYDISTLARAREELYTGGRLPDDVVEILKIKKSLNL